MSSANKTKDILYIDVDDEITTLIDRLNGSAHKIVVLVLPKRAAVLQSIVNMKLLKRAADQQKKHVVLVTSESSLLPLAGAVGLHVATTPNSKPIIPQAPDGVKSETDEIDEEDFDPKARAAAPIGALAGAAAASKASAADEDTIQLDNDDTDTVAPSSANTAKSKSAKPKKSKNKKLKVPDIDKFKKKSLLIGGGVLALILVWVFGFMILPKATIAIKTDSEDIQKRIDVTFDTNADEVDSDSNIVPAELEQTEKVNTQSVQASGQENRGEKARGEVEFSVSNSQACGPEIVIPAGTGVSRNNLTFITQTTVRLGDQGDVCRKRASSDIVAQTAGANYNLGSGKFTVSSASDVDVRGSAKGGTDNIVKFVTQGDIDSLNQKLNPEEDQAVKDQLASKLEDRNLFVIRESFNTGTPETTISAKVGDQTDNVTGNQKVTYSMIGVKKKDLETLIVQSAAENIDTKKQSILNTGLDEAVFKLQNQQNNSQQVQMSMDVTALAGPKLDDDRLKEQIAGKKSGEVRDTIKNYPGVTDVEVELSPFWVTSVPKSAKKITISYEK